MKKLTAYLTSSKKGFFSLLLLLVLFALCFSAPLLLFRRLDTLLLQGSHPRQLSSGKLASSAEEIYLVRVLHQRLQFQKAGTVAKSKAVKETIDSAQVKADFTPLAIAGVLPEVAYNNLIAEINSSTTQITKTVDESGVALIHCTVSGEYSFTLSYEIEEITGTILRCWTVGNPPSAFFKNHDSTLLLENYLAYTGLSRIDDWQSYESVYAKSLQSKDGQLMVYCDNAFSFGLSPL